MKQTEESWIWGEGYNASTNHTTGLNLPSVTALPADTDHLQLITNPLPKHMCETAYSKCVIQLPWRRLEKHACPWPARGFKRNYFKWEKEPSCNNSESEECTSGTFSFITISLWEGLTYHWLHQLIKNRSRVTAHVTELIVLLQNDLFGVPHYNNNHVAVIKMQLHIY